MSTLSIRGIIERYFKKLSLRPYASPIINLDGISSARRILLFTHYCKHVIDMGIIVGIRYKLIGGLKV